MSPYKIIIIGLFFSIIIGLFYFLMLWPGWQIKQINISLQENTSLSESKIIDLLERNLARKYYRIFSQRNIILTSAAILDQSLKQSYPQIADVKIEKDIAPHFKEESKGSVLSVSITEKESVAVWCEAEIIIKEPDEEPAESNKETAEVENEVIAEEATEPKEIKQVKECYYLDKDGIVYGKSPIFEGGLILSINDFRPLNVELGRQVLEKDVLGLILGIDKQVPAIFKNTPQAQGLGVSVIEIFALEELNLITNEGWQIIFNTHLSATSQLGVLRSVLTEDIKENRSSLQYIDLRIENRAYYK